MRKLLSIILTCLITLSAVGCGETTTISVNAASIDNLTNSVFGKSAMVEIGDGLYYDSTTRIVYWWNGFLDFSNYAATPTPYYAPNGFPYRYNPETNTFEEIA